MVDVVTLPDLAAEEFGGYYVFAFHGTTPNENRRVLLADTGAVGGGTSSGGSLNLPVAIVSGATYTFTAADAGVLKRFTNAGGCIATIPLGLATPVGSRIYIHQVGAGAVSLSWAAGVTVQAFQGQNETPGQYSQGWLTKVAADTYSFVTVAPDGGTGPDHVLLADQAAYDALTPDSNTIYYIPEV